MNKQELIDKYEVAECVMNFVSGKTLLKSILRDLKQLDEQKPVKVPQVVADVIEGARKESPELEDAFKYAWEVDTIEFREWFRKLENRNNFTRAWLDGYKVEEEKRYLVKIKGNIKENMLVYGELLERYFFTKSLSLDNAIYSHTRKELEDAGFGWVFDCPGIEIEEVE